MEGLSGWGISSVPGPPPKHHEHKRLCTPFTHPFILTRYTAVEQVVACAPVAQRARVRFPVGTSFLGEVFSGFFLTCKTNVRKLWAPKVPEFNLAIIIIIIIHNHFITGAYDLRCWRPLKPQIYIQYGTCILTRRIRKDEYDGQMIVGDLVGLKFPDICLTGEEKTSPRKPVPIGDSARTRCVTGAHATASSGK